jgi:8-oxo-dGTP pyrophosphatase MutT (NUDIX family)
MHLDRRSIDQLSWRSPLPGDCSLVVGAVICNPDGEAFVQRRRQDHELFPGCWDIVGGHAETGETAEAALRREIHEETGWELDRILRKVTEMCWQASGTRRLELDFAVEVTGDLDHPRLDPDEHDAWRWIAPAELPMLLAGGGPVGKAVHDIIELAFRG